MSKKFKGVILNSTTPYGVGVYEDAKARFIWDFCFVIDETDVMRSKLEAARQRKLKLAAEVRFLRRRYEYFVKTKTMGSTENKKLVEPSNAIKQNTKKVMEARKRLLPPISESKPKKKRYIIKEVSQNHKKILHGGKRNTGKESLSRNATPVLDLNQMERMHVWNDSASRNLIAAFDLNRDSSSSGPSGKEASLPARAPIFDLNEISTGDEDILSNVEGVKFDEVKKSSIRGTNDDMQNDVKLSICRNAGEGSSRVGKRKISWMDPVALRV
ncbi:hypothetical protein BUALT_Bualt16G0091000 [Buddleja alternifolia]|uniref:Uncharacterized protein n=1 Tax=Buddleja alternifolia TaxID=168488 RepID=A0AAV6WA98_9LAMI|nr:hypothetical protein BUALT_Bualt16G0091000 [Buddleja alternifolia]